MRESYHHGASPTPLAGATIGEHLAGIVERRGDGEALVSIPQGVRWTYRELWSRTEALARGLIALGVERGDHVGIWSTNNAEWVLLQLATARIGAVLVNVNPAWRVAELEYGLRRAEVRVLFLIPSFRTSAYEEMLVELCPELGTDGAGPCATVPTLEKAVIYDPAAPETTGARGGAVMAWPEVLAAGEGVSPDRLAARERGLDRDDPINVQFTSGTTGHPKAVVLTHHNLLNNALLAGGLLDIGSEDRLCVPVPFYHCFGMVVANLLMLGRGGAVVIPSEHFDPEATLAAVQNERCTVIHGVPTMFIEQLEHPRFGEFDLSTLRTGIMAGAPCPPELVRRVMEDMTCADIRIGYGMTEVSPLSHLTRAGDSVERRTRTVGLTVPHLEVKITNVDSGATVLIGEKGEVCFRGYQVMRGYMGEEEATAETIDAAGWLRSGDLGVMDEDGYVAITGRLKNMIVRGGENIYPAEIEAFYFEHPKIADIAVFGLPDERLGEDVAAWVRLHPGEECSADELREWARDRIAHHKIPRRVWFVDEFPETVTGKVQKFRMREISAGWLEEES